MMQNQDIQVLPVQLQDYRQWVQYWLAYQNFYKVSLSSTVTQTTWQRFFDEAEPVYCAVAKQGEHVLGIVHYVIHRSTWAEQNFCYLEDLYVSPEVRGRQIGKRLIEYVQQQAMAQHCARLYWHTQEINLTAQKLYDRIAEKPGVIEYRMPLIIRTDEDKQIDYNLEEYKRLESVVIQKFPDLVEEAANEAMQEIIETEYEDNLNKKKVVKL